MESEEEMDIAWKSWTRGAWLQDIPVGCNELSIHFFGLVFHFREYVNGGVCAFVFGIGFFYYWITNIYDFRLRLSDKKQTKLLFVHVNSAL